MDLFNADEFGYFYQMAPETTIAHTLLPGRKKKKQRLTYLACTNANGSERYRFMIIGMATTSSVQKAHRTGAGIRLLWELEGPDDSRLVSCLVDSFQFLH